MFNNIFTKKISQVHDDIQSHTEDNDFSNISLLESVVDINNELNTATMDYIAECYVGILEDSSEIVSEAFGDYVQKIKKFFEDMIKNLKEFIGKSIQLMQTRMGQTKSLIKKHGEEIKRGNYNFNINGYTYTTSDNCPNTDILDELIREYNSELSKIKDIDELVIRERRKVITSDEYKQKVKKRVLCTSNSISDDDFTLYCRKHFRDGQESKHEITITNKEVTEIINGYSKLDKEVTEMVKIKNKLTTQFKSLENFFTNGAVSISTGETGSVTVLHGLSKDKKLTGRNRDEQKFDTSDSSLNKINTYLSYRLVQTKTISNIIMTVVDAKCKALQSEISQSDRIIGKCIFGNKPRKEDENEN